MTANMTFDTKGEGQELIFLRDRAQEWLVRTNGLVGYARESNAHGRITDKPAPAPIPTAAYADLIFAFGLARQGCASDARNLLERARRELEAAGEVHPLLCAGYGYRIEQAIESLPHAGRLHNDIRERIGRLGRRAGCPEFMVRYAFERACVASRILDPDARLNPYRFVSPDGSVEDTHLEDAADDDDLRKRLQSLRKRAGVTTDPRGPTVPVIRAALGQALWAGRDFAVEVLAELLPAYDRDRRTMPVPARVELLSSALLAAIRYARRDFFLPLAARARELAPGSVDSDFVWYGNMLEQCVHGYHAFALRNELEDLLDDVTDRLRGGIGRTGSGPEEQCAIMRCLLAIAVGRYLLDQTPPARAIVVQAGTHLFALDLRKKAKVELACAYAAAAARSPNRRLVWLRMQELFARLEGIEDAFTTKAYFSESHMQILEAVVLAVTEPATVKPNA
jgi:hypothetical protein